MKINNDPKLDFDDVLLVPQRSKTASRKEVELNRNFSFYHSTRTWSGIPIFAANMDTTGTFAMSNKLREYNLPTCIHKHYEIDTLKNELLYPDHQWWSMGIKDSDVTKLVRFVEHTGYVPNLCIDVANGYTDDFVNFCNMIRERCLTQWSFNSPIIMAGNVCTPEMVQEIILHGGVDIVKIGIGPGSACTTRLKTGCFTADSKVNTSSGPKNIKDVSVGELVLTHDGTYQPVTNIHNNGFKDNLVEINGITCTDDHEFYVVNKSDQDKITEYNIHDFAYWLEAKNISEENHFIIEIL